ncbi:MAG: 4-hydroxy-tetrahydrodipicolinate reductase, partial [Myxococcota bacterium]
MKMIVNGAHGKMGRTLVQTLTQHPTHTLVAEVDKQDTLAHILDQHAADVVIDFSHPQTRMEVVHTILSHRVSAVIGTSGFIEEDLQTIQQWVETYQKGCLIAPNFIIGNVLMQQFAKKAAEYYEHVEIIEYHHDQKVDSPSGTAYKTAQLMAEARTAFNPNTRETVAHLEGARGANYRGINIHSVRLPGFLASQEVLLGSPGEYLTLRHDNIDRQAYMPGVLKAAEYIHDHTALV